MRCRCSAERFGILGVRQYTVRSRSKEIALFWKAPVPGTSRDPVLYDLVRLALPLLHARMHHECVSEQVKAEAPDGKHVST
jgi:hypothetical protein